MNGNIKRIGTPKEYGSDRRPYSDSPVPPHPNDQFSGLAGGGMHADELVKSMDGRASSSDQTLSVTSVQKSATKTGSKGSKGVSIWVDMRGVLEIILIII